ncbi:MAG: DUF1549 domain-containing protein, partial [Planctomycetaceae bacterium]|nr:DUF1549 domain-containing protein [Planctomycetaceae bacterium]
MVRWHHSLLLCLFCTAADVPADDGSKRLEFFETRIRPVLVEHCYSCHSADAKSLRGGLWVDHRDGLREGGDSGPAVVPGAPEDSLLLQALRYESFEMPPSGKLPQHIIDDFETWIETGATDPREAPVETTRPASGTNGIDLEAGREFWSFRPLSRSEIPQPRGMDWCESDMDRFLLARIEAAGLAPSADVPRRTLIRRAYYDLIGMPPPPAQTDAFVADPSPTPQAFARVVDELLESPHFGERWGRHWLDVARYAESTGGGRSLLYGTSWRYRDYVIDAFNKDKPFDRFLIEQIAGDLLPFDDYVQQGEQLTATAFLALGPTNYELQDKEQLRMDVIDEQIDTVGRAFLGMTLGCARCHDHKFDPVPTSDYYALAGIFRSTKTLIHANVSNWVSRPLPLDPESQRRLDQHRAQVVAKQAEIESLTSEADQIEQQLPQTTLDDPQARIVAGSWTKSSSTKGFVGDGYRYASGPGNAVEYRLPLKSSGTYDVRVSYSAHSNRSPAAPFTVLHRAGESEVRLDQRAVPPIDGLYASLGVFDFDDQAVIT